MDSRTILDQLGAEALLGAGDMLFMPPGTSKLTRIHGAYVSDREIGRIVAYVRQQGKPAYDESIAEYEEEPAPEDKTADGYDEKYDEAVALVDRPGAGLISLVQRIPEDRVQPGGAPDRAGWRRKALSAVGRCVKPRKVLARKAPH